MISPSSGDLVHDVAKRRRTELDHIAISGDTRGDERRATGQHVDVTGEVLRMVHDDGVRGAARAFDDLDGAADHDVETEAAGAFGEQHVAAAHGSAMSARFQRRDLGGRQCREGNVFFADHGNARAKTVLWRWYDVG